MKAFKTKIIALCNQKGGVGKTTSSVNIASFLAITETPTLLIDMDPQANASTGLGIEIHPKMKSVYDVLINNKISYECCNRYIFTFGISLYYACLGSWFDRE